LAGANPALSGTVTVLVPCTASAVRFAAVLLAIWGHRDGARADG
jgi:hypothetical protein